MKNARIITGPPRDPLCPADRLRPRRSSTAALHSDVPGAFELLARLPFGEVGFLGRHSVADVDAHPIRSVRADLAAISELGWIVDTWCVRTLASDMMRTAGPVRLLKNASWRTVICSSSSGVRRIISGQVRDSQGRVTKSPVATG